jgi:hypothetical protein
LNLLFSFFFGWQHDGLVGRALVARGALGERTGAARQDGDPTPLPACRFGVPSDFRDRGVREGMLVRKIIPFENLRLDATTSAGEQGDEQHSPAARDP